MKAPHVLFFRVAPLDLVPDETGNSGADRDYLRYDRGFVLDTDPTIVAFPTLSCTGGVYPQGPTEGRWTTGHRLREIMDRAELNDARVNWEQAGRWTTYRHPRDCHKAENYAQLVPVTLREVLAAKSLDDVPAVPRGW